MHSENIPPIILLGMVVLGVLSLPLIIAIFVKNRWVPLHLFFVFCFSLSALTSFFFVVSFLCTPDAFQWRFVGLALISIAIAMGSFRALRYAAMRGDESLVITADVTISNPAAREERREQPPKVQTLIWDKKPKRVLVLSGGGAKGAYAFGCLKAFKEKGIVFDAVSGTSVGALNGLLWSADALDEGERLWKDLSFESVYPVAIVNPRYLPKFAVYLISFIFVFMNFIWNALNRLPIQPTIDRIFIILSMTAVIVPGVIVYVEWNVYFERTGSEMDWLMLSVFSVTFFSFFRSIIGIYSSLVSRRQRSDLQMFINTFAIWWTLCISLYIFLTFYLPYSILSGRSPMPSSSRLINLLPYLLVPLLGGLITGWNAILGEINKRITILSSTPLLATIRTILSAKNMQIPTFVTIAQHSEIFDPDNPTWGRPKWSWNKSKRFKDPIRDWTVEYKNIMDDLLTVDSKSAYCVASAALPFGIVPPVKIESNNYVDGGVFDNTPFFPFIEDFPCEQMYVVILESCKNEQEALCKNKITGKRWKQLRRSRDLLAYQLKTMGNEDPEIFSKDNDPPIHIPYAKVPDFPSITVFYPKQSLGNFLTGTLNFSPQYAKTAMEAGFRDTMERLG